MSWLRIWRSRLAAGVMCLLAASTAAARRPLTLATTDTVLTLSAGPTEPRVLSLACPAGALWRSAHPQQLVDKVLIDGKWEPVRWSLRSVEDNRAGGSISAVYESSQPRLRLDWEWQARARGGPVEHTIRITNLENRVVALPPQTSFTFNWEVPPSQQLRHLWIEKGAGAPTAEGTHEARLTDGYLWVRTSSTYARDGEPREPIPWMLVEETQARESGWYLGIEFSGRTRLSVSRRGGSLAGEAGLNPCPAPFFTLLPAGATFATPTIFLGAFSGGADGAGNVLRRWVAHVLLNPADLRNPSYPLLVSNSWGSGMEINEEKARRMIGDAAKLGLEMFHLDAGWFRDVGDWHSHPQKFPHGVASLADYAHSLGLKFGLWVDWTQAGASAEAGALSVHDPTIRDWLTRDVAADWKPEPFKGVTLDIGYPPAAAWCGRELERLVNDYHLDMLEHDGYLVAEGCVRSDHPHATCGDAPMGPEPWLEGSCSTDVSYHATRAYYEIYDELRRRHPGLLLEACNDGGRMVDFGTAAHTDYFSITDSYDPLSNRRAFYDASHVLPAPMLECYVERYPGANPAAFLYMLRSGMMGWCTLMQDTAAWDSEQHAAARRAFDLYKTRLRPLIRAADLYHIAPRPDSEHWDGVEYFATGTGQGVVYAFRGANPGENTHTYPLRGLRSDRRYALQFNDHTSPDREESGNDLMVPGLRVSLPRPLSSELIFIRELR
ncbi:MAG TPA: glycoside hydrolase family 36 protein [Terriglobia bacterium]|nr:glycoside hydrolase family 36 protein [Terriglobia bacterium]